MANFKKSKRARDHEANAVCFNRENTVCEEQLAECIGNKTNIKQPQTITIPEELSLSSKLQNVRR